MKMNAMSFLGCTLKLIALSILGLHRSCGTLPKVCQIGRLKKGLSSSLASSKVPERPLCPDLPTAAPAAPLSTAGSTINSADDTRTAETGAAAETTTSAPISQELMHQARNSACDEAAMT